MPLPRRAAGLGLEVHTGRAVVVIVAGTFQAPEIVLRHEIDLADPWIRESMHPYHQELGESGSAGEQAWRRGCEAARRACRQAIRTFVNEMRRHGLKPSTATVVARSLADPARIGSAHARAHAEERKLYREAVETALRGCGLEVVTLVENTLRAVATERLGRGTRDLPAGAQSVRAQGRDAVAGTRKERRSGRVAGAIEVTRRES